VLTSEEWGWVPASSVCSRRVRHFYHLTTTAPNPSAWSLQTPDGILNGDFHLYWVRLLPRPNLVHLQDQWLDCWHQELLDGTSNTQQDVRV
jgi:hypothetical protein